MSAIGPEKGLQRPETHGEMGIQKKWTIYKIKIVLC